VCSILKPTFAIVRVSWLCIISLLNWIGFEKKIPIENKYGCRGSPGEGAYLQNMFNYYLIK